MKQKIFLTPEELFFLGEILKAKYIDYDYVRLMKDIQKNYKSLKHKAIQSLMQKELIFEDFSGNVEVDSESEQLLKNIFFSRKELEISSFKETENIHKQKIHISDKLLVWVNIENNRVFIHKSKTEDVFDYLHNLFELNDTEKKQIYKQKLRKNDINESLIVRYICVEKIAANFQYIKIENSWYKGENNEMLVSVEIDDLKKIMDLIEEKV